MTPHDERRAFLTGFTGSAGTGTVQQRVDARDNPHSHDASAGLLATTAVVTPSSALLWTDGRYHLQASQQLSEDWSLMKAGLKDVLTVEEWLAKHLSSGDTVGIDPYLSSVRSVEYVVGCTTQLQLSVCPPQAHQWPCCLMVAWQAVEGQAATQGDID